MLQGLYKADFILSIASLLLHFFVHMKQKYPNYHKESQGDDTHHPFAFLFKLDFYHKTILLTNENSFELYLTIFFLKDNNSNQKESLS